jgi:hypothetical protein
VVVFLALLCPIKNEEEKIRKTMEKDLEEDTG